LVELATNDWVRKELLRLGATNFDKKITGYNGKRLETDALVAELIYAGGGNAVILFNSTEAARVFTQRLTRRVFRHAPGLEIVVAHSAPFEWEPTGTGFYDEQFKALRDGKLTQKKRARLAADLGMPGLGVTAECPSTGLVAAQRVYDPEGRAVSREVAAKTHRGLQRIAKERLRKLLEAAGDQLDFSDELDHLGRTGGEESYIAVVHVDGNEVGDRIKRFVAAAGLTNRETVERMRNCSAALLAAAQQAFSAAFEPLRQHQNGELLEDEPKLKGAQRAENVKPKRLPYSCDQTEEKKYGGKTFWPFRPLVLGGDDLTFVCDGRLGLSLAVIFMRAFTKATQEAFAKLEGNEQAAGIQTAAGVAIVKTHYPFRRAYELSEALTRSAKRQLREAGESGTASALDWHIASTGLSGSLETIRRREYDVAEGRLAMRPIWLEHQHQWRTWRNFNATVSAFNYGNGLAERRNKLKTLRSALRDGKTAVARFLKSYELTLPIMKEAFGNMHQDGWAGEYCAYFDALEAMDHHFLLEGSNDE
jgi:hypothetical protein